MHMQGLRYGNGGAPMKRKNPAAVALGKLAKGVSKTLSDAEIARRTAKIIEARRAHAKRARAAKRKGKK